MDMQATKVEIGRALLDGVNNNDLSYWKSCLADDYTASYPSLREDVDSEVAYQYNAGIFTAFPDLHFDVQRTVMNGDVMVYQWMASGTHNGPLVTPTGTIPATGKFGGSPGVLIAVVKDGKIVREETYWNQLELLMQLGVL